LHKEYGKQVPQFSMPVLETMLFAACLENNSWDATEQGYDRLNKMYYDLNEIRVSSVAEIEETLNSPQGDWSGLRIRSILRFVFETTYTYDYDKLKRLTQESGQKRLKKIDNMSPFIRNFTIQHCLGGYLVSLDEVSTRAAIHLGIVPPGSNEEQAGEFLKQGLKKADTSAFMHALRCLATDPRFIERLSEPPDDDEEFDVGLVEERFEALKKPRKKKKKLPPEPVKKAAGSQTAAKKKTAGVSAKVSAADKTATKAKLKKKSGKATAAKSATSSKKTAAKKTSKKPAAVKKRATKKTSVKKATAKKTPAKKKATKKSPVKKTTAKKAPVKKKVKKKSAVKKATAKKAPAKKKAKKKKAKKK
jgi:endonuclease-3